jgi:uncharacterized protein (TIGR03067 family)
MSRHKQVESKKKDLDLLQGTWNVTALEIDGQEMSSALPGDARIVIQGDRFTSTGMGPVYEGTLNLDPSTNPRQLNMHFDAGPEKGNTNLGIYELKGNTWRLCLATRGTVRPSSFASKPGSGFALETLTRGSRPTKKTEKTKTTRAPKEEETAAGPPTEFEGEWKMVSAVMNGQPMEESAVQWVRRVTRGNQTTVYAGPQVMMSMRFRYNASTSPRTIEYVNTAGANKGKTQHGIYELDDGLLRICVSAPGSPPPTTFESLPGDGRTYTVWQRT